MQPTPPPTPTTAPDPTTAVELWSVIGIWFSGIATASAVGVALWSSRCDRRRADAERRDQEKAQARLVVSRVASEASQRVRIVNNSSAQVLNVLPEYSVTGREDRLQGTVSSTETVPRDVLDPGEEWPVSVTYFDADGSLVATDAYYWSQEDTITITFTDSAGRRWKRVNNSEPERVLNG